MTKPATYSIEDGVCTITLNDGKVNALGFTMMDAISEGLEAAEAADAVVILTGSNEKFSAGFDLKVFQQGPEALMGMLKQGALLGERILKSPRPVIIANNGHCIAMGAILLLCADVRIGVEGKFKVGLNEVANGMTMPYFGVEICQARLSPQYLHRCLNLAELLTPDAAKEANFLDITVEQDQLMGAAKQYAQYCKGLNKDAYVGTKMRQKEVLLEQLTVALERDFGTGGISI